MADNNQTTASEQELEEMIAASDTGARSPGGTVGKLMIFLAFSWSVFQLWIASPLPYTDFFASWLPVLNNIDIGSIHLSYALVLAFLAYPALKSSPRDSIPIQDWIFAIAGIIVTMYLSVFNVEISDRIGLPNTTDLVVASIGLFLVLEAARRALGPPLMVIAGIFLCYVFFGHLGPDIIAWKGASYGKAMSHMWITTEGVFGVALGVSATMVFLFVLFGSMLEKAGAGNYFIWVAFSLLGHMKGGPAKAAVVSSALTGLVSGSSIANVVTTGTFTIPLMKRVGFSAEKAGAVEVASSTNGQLTPPVMGAAAFLMIEFVGISYIEVIKHAFLPAVIAYIALVYIVHLEACKAGMVGLKRTVQSTLKQSLIVYTTVIAGIIILSGVTYYFFGWMKGFAGEYTFWASSAVVLVAYVILARYATNFPELGRSDTIKELPQPGPIVKSGLYFLLPVGVLVWCLTVERLSPGLSAFYATIFMAVILLTHKPLKAMFRGESEFASHFKECREDFSDGMIAGARNMIGIGVATACAGIILGTVTLTGIGLVLAEFVEFISAGNLILMLIFTAAISLVLGMGLPTTANYIVVSSLMAPVIVSVGASNGLIVPLIAVHLFVFYFGILADDTPPVGLAAYAAAAISGGDPIKTGIQGFTYDIRTGILPFMFIFNTELLMIGITGPFHLFSVVASALIAMLIFAAATQGYFVTHSKKWETGMMLLITFMLFRPGFFMDFLYEPLVKVEASQIYKIAEEQPVNGLLRVHVNGETLEGDEVDKVVMLPVGDPGDGKMRLQKAAGLELREEGGKIYIDNIVFGSAAAKQKLDFDWEIVDIQKKSDRPDKRWFFIPALLLLFMVWKIQKGRKDSEQAVVEGA